jgi:O-antigen ligase
MHTITEATSAPQIRQAPRRWASRANLATDGSGRMLVLIGCMMGVLVFRFHELVPSVSRFVRPAILVGPVGILILLSWAGPHARAKLLEDKVARGVLIYMCWAAVTVPFALYKSLAFNALQGLLSLVFLVAAFGLLPATVRALQGAQFLFTFLAAIFAPFAILMGGGAERIGFGYSLDPNDVGAIVAMIVPLALGSFRNERSWKRVTSAISVALCLSVLVQTGSRGGTIALVISALAFTLLLPGAGRFKWLAVLGLVGLASWSVAPSHFRERMLTLNDVNSDYNQTDYAGRKQIRQRGWSYARENPVLGVGIGNFPVAEGNRLEDQGIRGKWSAAHNAYVQASAELGFVGGAIFIGMLALGLLSAWKWGAIATPHPPIGGYRPEFFASLIGLSVAAYFLSLAYFWALFALLGLVGLADRVRKSVSYTGTIHNITAGRVRHFRPRRPARIAPHEQGAKS